MTSHLRPEQQLRWCLCIWNNSQDPETSEKYDLRPAVGIAAIQLGIPKRMTAIHVLDFDEDGNEITINQGKTWVCVVYDTKEDQIVIE